MEPAAGSTIPGKELVYPDKEEFNFLSEYSKHFNTVEVDQWFWSLFEPKKAVLPKDSDVKSYAKSVPDNFKFTIKDSKQHYTHSFL